MPKQRRFSYKADMNGPVKIIKSDGSVIMQRPAKSKEINSIAQGAKLATDKQKEYMDTLNIKYTAYTTLREAQKLISDRLRANKLRRK